MRKGYPPLFEETLLKIATAVSNYHDRMPLGSGAEAEAKLLKAEIDSLVEEALTFEGDDTNDGGLKRLVNKMIYLIIKHAAGEVGDGLGSKLLELLNEHF